MPPPPRARLRHQRLSCYHFSRRVSGTRCRRVSGSDVHARVLRSARVELEELAHCRRPAEEGKAVAAPPTFLAGGNESKLGLAREEDAPARYRGGLEGAPSLAQGRLRLRTRIHGLTRPRCSRALLPPTGTQVSVTLRTPLWAVAMCATL